jgi:hypothetical protein
LVDGAEPIARLTGHSVAVLSMTRPIISCVQGD